MASPSGLTPGLKVALAVTAMACISALCTAMILTGKDTFIFLIGTNFVAGIVGYFLGSGGKGRLYGAIETIRQILLDWFTEEAGPGLWDVLEDYVDAIEAVWPELGHVLRQVLSKKPKGEVIRH